MRGSSSARDSAGTRLAARRAGFLCFAFFGGLFAGFSVAFFRGFFAGLFSGLAALFLAFPATAPPLSIP